MDPEPKTTLIEAQPAWREPFLEPQTIPAGWDTSALLPASAAEAEQAGTPPAESPA